jgi:hypothetical protein
MHIGLRSLTLNLFEEERGGKNEGTIYNEFKRNNEERI